MQLLAVTAIGVGKYSDMGFRAFRRENHHLAGWNSANRFRNGSALCLLGQVGRLAVLELIHIALNQELTVRARVELTPTLQLNLINTVHGAFGNRLDGHIGLECVERLTDCLFSVSGQDNGAGEAQGNGSKTTIHAHEISWRLRSREGRQINIAPDA